MLKFNPKKYYSYEEITNYLQAAQKQCPDFFRLESIGITAEKRKIWLASLTNFKTGAPESKPSVFLDANIHASEISGAQSCLYFIDKILKNKNKDSEIQFLLDHMNFYILPQVSPDGAEYYKKNNYEIRSAPIEWPIPTASENIVPQDLNGDGQILLMRKEDLSGGYKVSKANSLLMTQRSATDLPKKNEKFYNLYTEGLFKNYNSNTENQEAQYGLDFNRQFPANYKPDGYQGGAGAYPLSVPEIQNFVKTFVQKHRVFGWVNLHTYGGFILAPPAAQPEENFDITDMNILKILTEQAAEVSGYEALNLRKDFKYFSREPEYGTATDWGFEQRGVYAITIEIWDVWKAAGLKVKVPVSRYFKQSEVELVKIFNWAKSKFKQSDFFHAWKDFNHPQLGKVQIGGWKTDFLIRNPPPSLLEKEMQKVYDVILQFAKSLPIVKIQNTYLEKIDVNTYKLQVDVANLGFLPTYGSQQAIRCGAVKKPTVHVKSSKKLKVISGQEFFETEHLLGQNRFFPFHSPVRLFKQKNTHRRQFEFFLQGQGDLEIIFDFQRGGIIKAQVKI